MLLLSTKLKKQNIGLSSLEKFWSAVWHTYIVKECIKNRNLSKQSTVWFAGKDLQRFDTFNNTINCLKLYQGQTEPTG